MSRPRLRWMFWLAAYLLMMAAILLALTETRRRVRIALDNPQARAEWQRWQAAAQREAQAAGPVTRRPPRSPEPPTLILLRDHFAAVVGSCSVLASALFLFLLIVFRGAVSQTGPNSDDGDPC